VILRLAETLVALREADLLKKLERVDKTGTLAIYREQGVDPEESRIAFEFGRRMIETDPNDRERLSQLVQAAVEEPGLRRAWDWVAILLFGLAGEQLLIWKKPESIALPNGTSSSLGDRRSAPVRQGSGPQEGNPAAEESTKSNQPSFENRAIAIEYPGTWHVFKKYGQKWRHQGKATGIKKGRQEELLKGFAEGDGFLRDDDAVRLIQKTHSRYDKRRIMSILKPELRKVILTNLHHTHGISIRCPGTNTAKRGRQEFRSAMPSRATKTAWNLSFLNSSQETSSLTPEEWVALATLPIPQRLGAVDVF
jgi:hypothetical protein